MKPKNFQKKPLHYLALGDSYTIGEGVSEAESFPFQLIAALKDEGLECSCPTIIAKTGWTTKELQTGIESAGVVGKKYDLVTLLIGVNNQYRGEHLEIFQSEFTSLLDRAINFANGNPSKVIVLSIPDWGVTPFAIEGNKESYKIAAEIDSFNRKSHIIAEQRMVHYQDITQEYRQTGGMERNLIGDKLHPSAAVYQAWALKLKNLILSGMDFGDKLSDNSF